MTGFKKCHSILSSSLFMYSLIYVFSLLMYMCVYSRGSVDGHMSLACFVGFRKEPSVLVLVFHLVQDRICCFTPASTRWTGGWALEDALSLPPVSSWNTWIRTYATILWSTVVLAWQTPYPPSCIPSSFISFFATESFGIECVFINFETFWSSCLCLLGDRITGICHCVWQCSCGGGKSARFLNAAKRSTNQVTFQSPLSLLSVFAFFCFSLFNIVSNQLKLQKT